MSKQQCSDLTAAEVGSLPDDAFIKVGDVCRFYLGGINNCTLYRWMKQGTFPKAYRLGRGCTAFRLGDVRAYCATRSEI